MAVTTAEFEALVPLPYTEARKLMRTGDILLFHSSGLAPGAIEHFTHSLWSHAAFVWNMEDIDRVLLLESVDTYGVRATALSNQVNGSPASKPYPGKLLLARHSEFPYPAAPAQIGLMTRFAIDRLGYPYAVMDLVKIGMRIAAGLLHQNLPGHLEPQNAYVCSEYVAKCYEAMGIVLAPNDAGFMSPADIANDPKVSAVCAVTQDPETTQAPLGTPPRKSP